MNAVVSELKLPPQSTDAEQSVLGGLMLDNSAFDIIADVLGEADFYRRQHRLIYRAIERLIMDAKPADALTVRDALGDDLEDCGGIAYIGSLAVNTASTANIRRYAEIVKERATRRRLIEVCSVAQDALFSTAPTPEIVGKLEAGLSALAQRGSGTSRPLQTILTAVVERIDTLYKSDGDHLTGLSTGFVGLDEKTAGLQPGDLIVIAGRPSMGKTALAMNIVEHVANQGKTAAVFSLEMSDAQLVQRLLGSVARVNQHALRSGRLNDDDWGRISAGLGKLQDVPIVIEETNYLTASELRARARRIARTAKPELGLIVVDYLQLMATPGRNNRNEEVGDITRAMKTLAKELNIPVIALSQLNRGLESRPNKRPVMSDLRDSGNIEQDADVIGFLYREEVYDEETQNKGSAEFIIGKQRNGPTGMVRLSFRADITRFENFAGQYHYPEPKVRSRGFQPQGRARADLEG